MTRLTWRLWALLVAAVAGAAALFYVYFSDEDGSAPPSQTTVPFSVPDEAPDLLRPVLPDAVAEDFIGVWSGESIDKPGEGTSTDVLIIEFFAPAGGSWSATIRGTFPDPSGQELSGLVMADGMVVFQVRARGGDLIVRIGVDAEDASVLVGEATPVPGNDLADGAHILLERCRPDLPGC